MNEHILAEKADAIMYYPPAVRLYFTSDCAHLEKTCHGKM